MLSDIPLHICKYTSSAWLIHSVFQIGTAASEFVAPNITTVSRLLRLSPEIAGVTLVAIGNASSDLISNIISFYDTKSAELAVGELLGANLFLSCMVVGIVNITASEKSIQMSCISRASILSLISLSLLAVIIGM